MEEFNKQEEVQGSMELTLSSKSYLAETAKWAKFLAIMGFIGVGLMLLASLFMFVAGAFIPDLGAGGPPFPIGLFGLLYVFIAVIYFFFSWFLLKFSNLATLALKKSDSIILEESLKNQKSLYKLLGIVTIVGIVLYILVIVGFVIAGVVGAFNM